MENNHPSSNEVMANRSFHRTCTKIHPELHAENSKPIGLIFSNGNGVALCDMTFTQVLRRLNVDHTMLDFRASFRTLVPIMCTMSMTCWNYLAHVVGDKTTQAYLRSDMVEKRRNLMQEWANYIKSTKDAELVQKPEEAKTKGKNKGKHQSPREKSTVTA